jgi:nicotinate-nucleotide adenylyltransferase
VDVDERPSLGVIGGSFNPPHIGHLAIASDVATMLNLAGVVFTPAAAPVHKDVDYDVSAASRLEMTRLAVAGDERFSVSDVESDLGLRRTLDTIAELRQRHPDHRLVFIMGSDSLLQFDTWHQPSAILALCRVAVAPRPGDDLRLVEERAREWGRGLVVVLPTATLDISSSMIRDRLQIGLPIRYLVPDDVERYIRARRLYGLS